MQDKEKIIINDYINNDPLSEENLNETLEYVNKFRLSCPNKTIWLYTGFSFSEFFIYDKQIQNNPQYLRKDVMELYLKRQSIVKQCDILIDGRYIESQSNPSLRWRGSSNQRVIDIQESLKQNKIVLHCD